MQEVGVVYYCQVFDFEFCDVRIHLDVLFIQVVIYSIYINLFSLHAGDCRKTDSSLIVSSKIVNPSVYLSKISPT